MHYHITCFIVLCFATGSFSSENVHCSTYVNKFNVLTNVQMFVYESFINQCSSYPEKIQTCITAIEESQRSSVLETYSDCFLTDPHPSTCFHRLIQSITDLRSNISCAYSLEMDSNMKLVLFMCNSTNRTECINFVSNSTKYTKEMLTGFFTSDFCLGCPSICNISRFAPISKLNETIIEIRRNIETTIRAMILEESFKKVIYSLAKKNNSKSIHLLPSTDIFKSTCIKYTKCMNISSNNTCQTKVEDALNKQFSNFETNENILNHNDANNTMLEITLFLADKFKNIKCPHPYCSHTCIRPVNAYRLLDIFMGFVSACFLLGIFLQSINLQMLSKI
jgi:hypothetical protein